MAEAKMPNMADSLREQLPSNSKTTVAEGKEKKERLQAVTSDKVSIQKESIGKRFLRLFLAEDVKDVKEYMLKDVLIPGVKTALLSGLEMLFFARASGHYGQKPYDYNRAYNQQTTRYSYTPRPVQGNGPIYADVSKAPGTLRPINFVTKADAQSVYAAMMQQLDIYGEVTVMQYYDLCGVESNFSDDKWGWRDISRVRIMPVRGGYILDLGSPMYLE